MKLNELVCPICGLKCMTDASYTTCASCNTTFYAHQSRSVDCPVPVGPSITINPFITAPVISPDPIQPPVDITPFPIWVAPFGPPGSLYGPTVTCATTAGGMAVSQDQFQIWN
jgi:hypothetical protein